MGAAAYTSGPLDAELVIVGEAWGAEEERQQRPFIGASGQLLEQMLSEAGLDRVSILCTNIVDLRPDHDKMYNLFDAEIASANVAVRGLRPHFVVRSGLDDLYNLLDSHPRRLVIAAGNYPLWALTDVTTSRPNPDLKASGPRVPSGIGNYRGSQLFRLQGLFDEVAVTSLPVLPIYHPASIMRNWSTRAVTVHDLRSRVPIALRGQSWDEPSSWAFTPRPNFHEAVYALEKLIVVAQQSRLELSIDVETKRNSEILTCLGLAWSANEAICIPFAVPDGADSKGLASYWTSEQEKVIRLLLCALFRHAFAIGQNFVYDTQVLWNEFGLAPRLAHDTLIAQNLLFPGTQKDLGYLSSLYCAQHRYWKDDNREWSDGGTLDEHLRYNCIDTVRTYEIATEQRRVLIKAKLDHLYPEELDKFRLATAMMRKGLRVDESARTTMVMSVMEQMATLDAALLMMVPQATIDPRAKTSWFNSPKRKAELLYQIWGLKVQLDKKTKSPTTSKEALTALSKIYPKLSVFFNALKDRGSLSTIAKNFLFAKRDPDGRWRGAFNPAGTETFRWSSQKNAFGRGSNMQNLPAGGDDEMLDDVVDDEEDA